MKRKNGDIQEYEYNYTDTMRNRRFKIYGLLKWILTELKNMLIYTVNFKTEIHNRMMAIRGQKWYRWRVTKGIIHDIRA